jgi:ribonuclease HII
MQIQVIALPRLLADKTYILGSDECGYGALCSSLVVCGVRAPKDWELEGLNDSKKLSPKRREVMREKLLKLADSNVINYHIAERPNTTIDQFGVAMVLKDAYVEVFKKLYQDDCLIITDGTLKFDNLGIDDFDKVSLIKADGMIPQVMAASILGKTYRDANMRELHKQYPQYDWEHNMGYPNPFHLQAIKQYGPCPLHRMSYAPMRKMILPDPRQLKIPGT